MSTKFITRCHSCKICTRPYLCASFTTAPSTLAAPFVYNVFQWPYQCSYQKVVQTSRSSVGHQGCILYHFFHFLGDLESVKMVREKFWQIRRFGMVCYAHWNFMSVIMLTWSERCVSVHTGSLINLFSYHWLSISLFNQMMFELLCPFTKVMSYKQIRRSLNAWLYRMENH